MTTVKDEMLRMLYGRVQIGSEWTYRNMPGRHYVLRVLHVRDDRVEVTAVSVGGSKKHTLDFGYMLANYTRIV